MKKHHSAPVQDKKRPPKPIQRIPETPAPRAEKKMLRVDKAVPPQLRYSNVRLKVRNIDNQKVTNDEIRVSTPNNNKA